MHGALRIALLAALAALLLLPGGASARARQNTFILTVHVEGQGRVVGDQGGLDCHSTDCDSAPIDDQTDVTLTETPDAGWVFLEWDSQSSNCSGVSKTCTLTISDDDDEYATFVQQSDSAQLNVQVNGNGSVTGDSLNCTASGGICSRYNRLNDSVTLSAHPGGGAAFQGWGGGACSGLSPTCTVTMSSAKTVIATFAGGSSTFPLTVLVSGNGTVTSNPPGISCAANAGTCSQNFNANTTVTLTVAPASGSTFQGWTGSCVGTTACTLTMNAAKSVTATFTGGSGGSTFPLTVSVVGNGTVNGGGISCSSADGTCTQSETANSSVTLTAVPDSGAAFKSWGGACTGTKPTCTVQMTAAKTVAATFTGTSGPPPAGTQTLTIVIEGHGTVADAAGSCTSNGVGASCTQVVSSGTALTLTPTPGAGAKFGGWSGSCTGAAACHVTLSAARTVTANFTGATAGTLQLASLGEPIVQRLGSDFLVTVRFSASRRGTGKLRVLQRKHVIASITLNVHAGKVRFGPFLIKKQGQTQLVLNFTDVTGQTKTLQWSACIGACTGSTGGTPPPKQPKPPAKKPKPPVQTGLKLTRGAATSTPTKTGASVTLHFTTNEKVTALVSVLRNGKVVLKGLKFSFPAGPVALGPFAINTDGTYDFRLVGADAKGRHASLAWRVVVPKK